MMNKSDFREFLDSKSDFRNDLLDQSIIRKQMEKMRVSGFYVFGKLVLSQLLGGIVSVLICDQFGMRPFSYEFSLSTYFMNFGHNACMFLCGFLFLAMGISASYWILNLDERNYYRKHFWLQTVVLTTLFLSIFFMAGASISFVVGVLWILGGILGAYLIIKFLDPLIRFRVLPSV